MKIAGLVDALNLFTDIPFTEWAWSTAPANGYGVVTADGQSELKADADPVAEKMLTGYVDVFVKATDPDPTDDVEAAMKALGVWFRMESIQFEPETGFIHYEWRYTDVIKTAGKAFLTELPIMLHVIRTEGVTVDGHTYRKVIFADGETDMILEYAKTRDMYFCLPYWEATETTPIWFWLRKVCVKEALGATEIQFAANLPNISGYEKEETLDGYLGIRVSVSWNADGTFRSAIATHFMS